MEDLRAWARKNDRTPLFVRERLLGGTLPGSKGLAGNVISREVDAFPGATIIVFGIHDRYITRLTLAYGPIASHQST